MNQIKNHYCFEGTVHNVVCECRCYSCHNVNFTIKQADKNQKLSQAMAEQMSQQWVGSFTRGTDGLTLGQTLWGKDLIISRICPLDCLGLNCNPTSHLKKRSNFSKLMDSVCNLVDDIWFILTGK